MSNNRSKPSAQKLIPIPVNENFERELIAGLKQLRVVNRSQFIRDAILEKLARAGIAIPAEFALPPYRTGKKTEPRKFRYPAHKPSAFALNEKKTAKKSGRKSNS